MIQTFIRRARIYAAMAAMQPKYFLAYTIWVWMDFVVNVIAIVILVAFWTAVYTSKSDGEIGGLALQQTLTYIILARIFSNAASDTNGLWLFGSLMREGQVGIELLRPVDLQLSTYVQTMTRILIGFLMNLPVALIAWLLFRYQVPTDPVVWLAFFVSLFLGVSVLFFFDWALGCIAFYSTEVWGLSVLRFGFSTFFSGQLIPLQIMPDWLRNITAALPFSHALYNPVSILSGITPVAEAPRIWLIELVYLAVFLVISRLVFRVAVRTVTVQGG